MRAAGTFAAVCLSGCRWGGVFVGGRSVMRNTALYTLEITGKDIGRLEKALPSIPANTPVNIAFLGNEVHGQRIRAAGVIRESGLEPVPIVSARRLTSREDLYGLLDGLHETAAPKRFLFVGGDPEPAGPFFDALELLSENFIERYGIRVAGIGAYPEGHPKIPPAKLWEALAWKCRFLHEAGCEVELTTQLGFDTALLEVWLKELRERGIDVPVRIGVPGPADAALLFRYAKQFGVASSAGILKRYGLALGQLLRRSLSDRYWDEVQALLAKNDFGTVAYHLYPFGGLEEGVAWINRRLAELSDKV